MEIINLTQHNATEEQIVQGVVEPNEDTKNKIKSLLTFNTIPTALDMKQKAMNLAAIAKDYGVEAAMIGGAPYFMPYLEKYLMYFNIRPLYAFSQRVSKEQHMPDGTVQKINVFKHIGFVQGGDYE